MHMTRRSSRAARGLLAAAMLMLMMGCQSVEPPDYTTIADADAVKSTRSEMMSFFTTAAELASSAVGGGELRNGESVVGTTCGEPYDESFETLEIGGSFLAKGRTLEEVLDQVSSSWEKQDWEVTVTAEDRVSLKTTTSTGVDVLASATLQEVAGDPESIGVSLKALTGCLKLP